MSIRKYRRKSGIRYQAIISIPGRKQLAKSFERRVDAQAWEREQRTLLQRGELETQTTDMTVKELAAYWLENYAKVYKQPSSWTRDEGIIRCHLLPAFGRRPLGDLTVLEVERFVNRLHVRRGMSASSVNQALGVFRKMLNDAVRWQFIRYNPILGVPFLKRGEQDFGFWTKSEAAQFLAYAKDHAQEQYPIFVCALYTGMRRGEIRGLLWDCVDFDNRFITVKRGWCEKSKQLKETTKSKRIRRVPINSSLMELLREMSLKREGGEFVFTRFNWMQAARLLKSLSSRAGVKPIRFHDLRHSFASNFMMSGGKIYDLQKLLGHSTVQMTERYSHLSPEHLAGTTELLDFGTRDRGNVVQLFGAK